MFALSCYVFFVLVSPISYVKCFSHIYFSLKDDEGSIQCAMFKGSNMGLNFNPKDGDECIVSGNISLFIQRGNYQLIAKKMILAGQGNLMQEFEKLKNKSYI